MSAMNFEKASKAQNLISLYSTYVYKIPKNRTSQI